MFWFIRFFPLSYSEKKNCIRLFKSPCFLGLLLSSSFKRAETVGKYKVTLPYVLASRFILIHTESLKYTQRVLIDSVCRFVHSKKEHSFEVVGDCRYVQTVRDKLLIKNLGNCEWKYYYPRIAITSQSSKTGGTII